MKFRFGVRVHYTMDDGSEGDEVFHAIAETHKDACVLVAKLCEEHKPIADYSLRSVQVTRADFARYKLWREVQWIEMDKKGEPEFS